MGGGYGRSLVIGAGVALAVVAAVAVTVATVPGAQLGGLLGTREPERALVLLECEGADGVHLAQVILDVDMSGSAAKVLVVDPISRVEVPGTSYDTLRDAYPFGGGGAVAEAYARLTGGPKLPAVVVPAEEWARIVDSAGGVKVSLETTTDVFLGEGLYSFVTGENEVAGPEVGPLLVGLEDGEATADAAEVRTAVARAFVAGIAKAPDRLARLNAEGRLEGDTAGRAGEALVARLSDALVDARVSQGPAKR